MQSRLYAIASIGILVGLMAPAAFAIPQAHGQWRDTNVIAFDESIVGSNIYITSTVCGVIAGTISGPFCAYGNTIVDGITGVGTYTSIDQCFCNGVSGQYLISFSESGIVTPTTGYFYTLTSTATIIGTFGASVTSGTIYLNGYLDPATNLSFGGYTGTVN